MRAATRRSYMDHLRMWLTWMEVNGGSLAGLTPDQLVEHQRQAGNGAEFEILDLVQGYIGSRDWRHSTKKSTYAILRSLFMHNRAELPRDKGFQLNSHRPPTDARLTPEAVRDLVLSSNETYRAVFLSMFQGGLDLACFDYWNRNGWPELKKQLMESPDLVRISLPGRKHMRNVSGFYTFIGREAIAAIVNCLPARPVEGSCIFYTKPHGYEDGEATEGVRPRPVTRNSVKHYWIRHLDRIGLIDRSANREGTAKRYGFNLHEMRDVRRSLWEKSPAKASVCEYTMGHVVDPLEYNKAFKDEDWVRREYRKGLPYLNIMTGAQPYGLVDEDRVQTLEARIIQLERERDGALWHSDYALGRLDEAGVPVAPGDPASERRQLKIDLADLVLEANLLAARDPEASKARMRTAEEIMRDLLDMARKK